MKLSHVPVGAADGSAVDTMGRVTHGYYGADGACPRCRALDCHWGTDGDGVAVATCGTCGYRERVARRTTPTDAPVVAGALSHLCEAARDAHPSGRSPYQKARPAPVLTDIVPTTWTLLAVVVANSGIGDRRARHWVTRWTQEGRVEQRRDLLPVTRPSGGVTNAWVVSVRRVVP